MKMMYFPSFVSGSVFTARLFPLAGFFCPEYEPFNDGPPPPRDQRIYTGYMVLVNGLEPLPIRLQGDCSTIGAKPAYLAGRHGIMNAGLSLPSPRRYL